MLTRSKVFRRLKENGLPQKSGDWKDYELGKALFQNGNYIYSRDYENLIRFLTEYFNV